MSVVLLLLAVSGVHATRHHHADVIGGEHRVGTSYIRAPRSLAPYSVLLFNFAQVAGLQAVDRLLSPSNLHECSRLRWPDGGLGPSSDLAAAATAMAGDTAQATTATARRGRRSTLARSPATVALLVAAAVVVALLLRL